MRCYHPVKFYQINQTNKDMKQYSWKRDEDTGVAVLHWTGNGGRTWNKYYNPIPGKIYAGTGQMEKMRELQKQGYILVDTNIKATQAPLQRGDEGDVFTLDTYGEEDTWAPIRKVLDTYKEQDLNFSEFQREQRDIDNLREELSHAPKEVLEERAIEQVLNQAPIKTVTELKYINSFQELLHRAHPTELVELTLKLYRSNVKAHKLNEILREVGI